MTVAVTAVIIVVVVFFASSIHAEETTMWKSVLFLFLSFFGGNLCQLRSRTWRFMSTEVKNKGQSGQLLLNPNDAASTCLPVAGVKVRMNLLTIICPLLYCRCWRDVKCAIIQFSLELVVVGVISIYWNCGSRGSADGSTGAMRPREVSLREGCQPLRGKAGQPGEHGKTGRCKVSWI